MWELPTKTMKDFQDSDIFPVLTFYGDDPDEQAARYEIFKQVCHEWFNNRVVNDDELFPTFFKRNVRKFYPQYDQLIRVQPGVIGTRYDWMIEDYAAAISTVKSEMTNTGKDTSTITGTSTTSNNTTVTGSSEQKTDENHTGTDTTTTTKDDTRSSTLTKSGSEQTAKSGTDTDDGTANKTLTKSGDEVHDYGANGIVEERSIKGSYVEHTHHNTNDNTNNDTVTTTSGHKDHKEGQKVMPMSTSNGLTSVAAGVDGVDSFSVDFAGAPSNIGQTNDHDHETSETKGGPKVSHTGNDATEHRYGMHLDADGNTVQDTPNDDYKETNTKKGQETTRFSNRIDKENGTNVVKHEYDSATELSFVNRSDKTTETETGTDTTETMYNSGTNGSTTGTTSQKTESNGSGTNDTTTTAEKNGTQNNTGETRNESNGRHRAPAEIMENAVAFIESTNAWAWIQDKLETCFLGLWEL